VQITNQVSNLVAWTLSLHEERWRSGSSRYCVALSVQPNPYVMLARVTEVPPIIASSVHIETSVIQDLQARGEWGVVSGQDKPIVTGGLVSDKQPLPHLFQDGCLSPSPIVSLTLGPRGFVLWRAGSQRMISHSCKFPVDLGRAGKGTTSQVPGRCLPPVCHRVMVTSSPKTRSTKRCL
jgi:hypothetical protein